MVEHCPSCHRVGTSSEEIQARCGSFMTCAKRTLPVDPAKMVIVECGDCDVALALPASLLTSGKSTHTGAICKRSSESCLAMVVHPEQALDVISPAPPEARAPRGKSAKS